MTIDRARDHTPGATAICLAAILIAIVSIITGGVLMSKTTCDGQTTYESCGDPLSQPHLALGWSFLLAGLGFASILFVLGLIYREVTLARRHAELSSTTASAASDDTVRGITGG